jgi:hypothetical protein
MAKKPPALGIEPAAKPAKKPADAEKAPRQGNQPVCAVHTVQMVAYSSSAMYTYYRCPTDKCRETAKRVRPVGPLKDRYGHGTSARSQE